MSNHFTSFWWLLVHVRKFVTRVILPGLLILLFTACSSVPLFKPAIEPRDRAELPDGLSGGSSDGHTGGLSGTRSLDSSLRSLEPLQQAPARARKLFRKATKALEKKRYDIAEPILDKLIVQLPEFSSLHTNLGIVYANTSRTELALVSLHRAVELRPDDCAPQVHIGLLERQLREFDAAEKTYLACVLGDPNYAPAYLNLGILYELYLGRLPDALAAYERYQALSPSKRVSSWVRDLHRRVDAENQLAVGGMMR